MQCVACSAELPVGAMICGECGRAVSSTAPVAPPVSSTAPVAPMPSPEPLAQPMSSPEPVPHPAERFVLQFSTGESFTVTGTGIVGRNPRPEPGEYFDHAVTIADPGKSVSKTHLEFGQDDGSFWVSDRFSGNGTAARDPGSEPKRCEPGRRYRVARGGRVDIGDQFFVVS
jgi:FHA domain-containing protein